VIPAAPQDARPIDGFPGYLVTRAGQVLSCRTARGFSKAYRPMVGRPDAKGYLAVVLCAGRAQRRSVRIHRLVAEAFIPNPTGLPCVRHLDGRGSHNADGNLAWGTYAENEQDKRAHGTYDLRRTGKLSAADRAEARRLRESGLDQAAIAARFGVSRPTITRLLNGATWGDLDGLTPIQRELFGEVA
jgi:hypothetical protein